MSEIHILNVGDGDCTILRSSKGNVTIFDICGGNMQPSDSGLRALMEKAAVMGNFRMCEQPTNPIEYLAEKMGVQTVFRFILSHPDMDHLDGFDNLMSNFKVLNFWDSSVRKDKPDFNGSPYNERDWDRYVSVRDGNENVTVVSPKAGSENKYYNKDDEGKGGDYITVCNPTQSLVDAANNSNNANALHDSSYVIVYRTAGGKVLLAGDSHDAAWQQILSRFGPLLSDCEFMVAPHHGRDSDRSWEFLDVVNPKFSVLGCAPSEHLAYDKWNRRELEKVTQNQIGNLILYPSGTGLSIYAENSSFVGRYGGNINQKDSYGNFYLTHISKSSQS